MTDKITASFPPELLAHASESFASSISPDEDAVSGALSMYLHALSCAEECQASPLSIEIEWPQGLKQSQRAAIRNQISASLQRQATELSRLQIAALMKLAGAVPDLIEKKLYAEVLKHETHGSSH